MNVAPTGDSWLSPYLGDMYRRLSVIEWSFRDPATSMDEADKEYAKSLVLSYQANMGILADKLRTGEVNPFRFNFARFIDEEIELSSLKENWLKELRESPTIGRMRYVLAEMLEAILCWEILEVRKAVPDAVTLHSPYEPLVQFFELGGMVYGEHSMAWEFWLDDQMLASYFLPRVGKAKEKRKMKER